MTKFKLSLFLVVFCTIVFAELDVQHMSNGSVKIEQIVRSIALIYTDDKLEPEVEKFINHQPKIIWDDNAYVYLWGMNVKTDNPYKIGKEILEKLLAEDKLYNYEQHPLELSFLNDYPLYKTPESDLLCKKHKSECFEKIINNDKAVKQFLKDYGFYKSRYLTYLKFNYFNQIADRRLESPLPSFRTITIAQKVVHIYLLANLKNISKTKLVNQLESELIRLKNKLEKADTLIAKMIVVALINENIEMFNYLYQNKLINLGSHSSLFKPLSSSERSLYNAMYEEHSKNLKYLYDYISDPKRLVKKKYKPVTYQLMKLVYFIVAKPNLTANTVYNDYIANLLYLTQLKSYLYYSEIKQSKNEINHDPIRNFMVYKLSDGVFPDYYNYPARVFDIDMKLQLMRLVIQSESIRNLKQDDKFLSTYDHTPAFIKDDKICYSGMAKMFPEFRCLTIHKRAIFITNPKFDPKSHAFSH